MKGSLRDRILKLLPEGIWDIDTLAEYLQLRFNEPTDYLKKRISDTMANEVRKYDQTGEGWVVKKIEKGQEKGRIFIYC